MGEEPGWHWRVGGGPGGRSRRQRLRLRGGQFRGSSLTTPALSLLGNSDAFVAKLDAAGNIQWGRSFGGNSADAFGLAVSVDGSGNTYLGGYFWRSNLSVPVLPLIGNFDAYAIKLNAGGTVTWAKNFGGSGANAYCSGIAIDGAGDAYLAGNFFGANLTVPAMARIGSRDAMAIKLDKASGNVVWSKNFGGPSVEAYGQAVAVDGAGKAYLGGYFFNGNLTTPVLPWLGTFDAFAFKLDANDGTIAWARNFGGSGAEAKGQGIAVDGSGNVHLVGDGALASVALTPVNGGFALNLDSAGVTAWTRSYWSLFPGGHAGNNATAVDSAGNVYIAGYFDADTFMLGSATLLKSGWQDAFAAKIDSGGSVVWARNFGGYGAGTVGNGIAVDSAGGVSVVGTFDGNSLTTPPLTLIGSRDAFAVKLDAATGAIAWARNFGGSAAQVDGQAVAADGVGNVYVGGYFSGGNLSSPALVKTGYQDGFALKLAAADGTPTWAKNFGGSFIGQTFGEAIAVDGPGNVYLGGYFTGTIGTTPPLASIGNVDAFALKLDPLGATTWSRSFGGSGVTTVVRALAVDASGNVHLTGDIYGGNLTLPPLAIIGGNDAIAIKLDAAGAVAWARNFGGSGPQAQAFGYGIAVDGASNVYLSGFNFGTGLTTPPLTKIGADDAFALKLDAAGATTWAKNYGGANAWAHFRTVAVGGNGVVYLGGDMSINNLTTPPLTLVGDTDALILGQTYYGVSYDGNGNNGGSVPVDLNAYVAGAAAVVASNAGGLTRAGRMFAGWNTAASGAGTHYNPGDAVTVASGDVKLYAHWVTPGLTPILLSAASRRTHGASGAFDMPLSLADIHDPSTEPRQGPAQTIVFAFDMPINGGTVAIAAGAASASAPVFSGNSLIVGLSGVGDQQYVTVSLSNVTSPGGANGGSGSVRVGFLMGDVNQSRVVSIADLGLVNAQLAQGATAANFLKDVNASGTVTLADKGTTNFSLTRTLPPP